MIARIWRAQVKREEADTYFKLMLKIAIPDYQSTPGNRGAWCLRHDEVGAVYVAMLTFWDDLDALRRFAGEDVDLAKYYDFDRDLLVSLPERVEHYDIVGARAGP